jgi:hypothetical protein
MRNYDCIAAILIVTGAFGCSSSTEETRTPSATAGSAGSAGTTVTAGTTGAGGSPTAGSGGQAGASLGGAAGAPQSGGAAGTPSAGGSAGAPAAGGSAGSVVDSGAGGAVVDSGPPRDSGPITWPACTQPPCITQVNNCAIPIWVHPLGSAPVDNGTVRKMESGATLQYAAVPQTGGGRIYAYYKEPTKMQDTVQAVSPFNQFVEMTVDKDGQGNWAQNYNISYVDHISMPVSMVAVPRAGQTCGVTECRATFDQIVTGCPTDVRNLYNGIGQCMGSYNYCITQDPGGGKNDAGKANSYDDTKEYCYKMVKPADPTNGIPDVVRGSMIYGGIFMPPYAPNWAYWEKVAGFNRGTFAGDTNDQNFYKTEPYNHYAGWIHVTLGCARVYAFSTDDHQNKSGFVRCSSDDLRITWCPNG